MGESAINKRRRRVGVILPAAIVLLVGGAIGGGLALVDGTLDPAGDAVRADGTFRSGGSSGLVMGFVGHTAEPFVPCSSSIIDCFSKAEFARGSGSRFGAGPGSGASRSRGPRSRSIPPRAPALAESFPAGVSALDDTVSTPLTQLAEGLAPFSGGAGGGGTQALRLAPFFPAPGIGGIGGEVAAAPASTPSPTPSANPTTTPAIPEMPIPAVPEPATWLQMLIGFAIVGIAMRWRRVRRGAANFS